MEQNLEPRKKYIGKLIYDKGEKKKGKWRKHRLCNKQSWENMIATSKKKKNQMTHTVHTHQLNICKRPEYET